ncbi:MAG: GIY-YIG nuclease family protein [Hyphomicrobium sp.]|uniref:GIY-YIG nuclease family protein n=1 Tax=Hyphomicrobium sp. TaxID=82 RepID=UPI003D10D38C
MDRQAILDEIRRTAEENGGQPLGRLRLEKAAGIKEGHWKKYWARFGDACKEAGFEPNKVQEANSEESLVRHVIALCRELGRFPTISELRVKRTYDINFPSIRTFEKRLGGKADIVQKTLSYCRGQGGLNDVAAMCSSAREVDTLRSAPSAQPATTTKDGFVYLMKSGRFYKIGKTNHVGRRERELSIQLPEQARTVHKIRTDDPDGIEAYWHLRFAAKRKNGEWFDLSRDEVAAFRRRKFM